MGFALAVYLFSWDRHSTKRRGHPALALLVLLPDAVAIEGGYCAYPQMDTDTPFASLRADPEFADGWAEARAAGKECHEHFLAETGAGRRSGQRPVGSIRIGA